MTIQEKAAFLMETIPSEKEVLELKRRYLFSGIEEALLLEASRTLHDASPDSQLIDLAYELIQLHRQKKRQRRLEKISVQEKMERILALFSNPADLQAVLDMEEWGPGDRRAIQLVSHFVANDIPLMSNFKIVDKVYKLLDNAHLPPEIAEKYFGRRGQEEERKRILDKFRTYLARRKHLETAELAGPEHKGSTQRYGYMMGTVLAIAAIFMAGFYTAKYLYDSRAVATLTPAAMDSLTQKKEKKIAISETQNGAPPLQKAQTAIFSTTRTTLQNRLESYGFTGRVDFVSNGMVQKTSNQNDFDQNIPEAKLLDSKATSAINSLTGPLKVAVEGLGGLHGLKLPLAVTEQNLSMGTPVPEGFRLEADETPATRLLYLTDGETFYPVEIYAFTAEPVIVEYRLIAYKPGHYMPVVSNIWHFSDLGELRMHKHFVYQKGRIAPAKIIANHFLPGGGTVELVSVSKLDRRHRARELPLARKDYLPSAKLLYQELYEIDRLAGEWRSRLVRQVWYDEGKKILAKGLEPTE